MNALTGGALSLIQCMQQLFENAAALLSVAHARRHKASIAGAFRKS
jgi:hypothetical protein